MCKKSKSLLIKKCIFAKNFPMKYYLYIFSLLVSSFVFSQTQKTLSDSEYQKLHDKARILLNSDIDSSFIYASKIEKSNSNLHKSFAFGIKSYIYQLKGNKSKSKEFYKKAFIYLDKTPESIEKIKHNAYLLAYGGLSEWKRGNLSAALELYLKGKKLSAQVNDIVQIIKFNINISNIYDAIQNYKLAIKTSRESDKLIDKYENLYTLEQYENNKSNTYLSLGSFYSNYYWNEKSNSQLLDSSRFFFQKAIIYSKKLIENKTNAQIGISSIYQFQKNHAEAEKNYINLLYTTKNNKLNYQHYLACYNLGRFYFELKKHDKSIIYFNKADSINKKNNFNTNIFIYTNYYLSKLYEIKDDPENAFKFSKINLDNFEKNEYNLNNETIDINSNLEKIDIEKEMIAIQEKYRNEVLFKKWTIILSVLLFIGLIILLVKNITEKNRVKKKVNDLIKEFSIKIEEKNMQEDSKEIIPVEFADIPNNKQITISIDEAKEIEILTKLKTLEEKKFYLKAEFNQKEVAKKLRTNTTYLSYVVNKNFKKSFSEYSNELKINYVINEMLTNPTYRKYSTQAIAESVGFKNAISFTKSFNKRTGVTPVQFIKGIN